MPESNRRHQAPEACALSAELIARCCDGNAVFAIAPVGPRTRLVSSGHGATDIQRRILINTTCRRLSRDVSFWMPAVYPPRAAVCAIRAEHGGIWHFS